MEIYYYKSEFGNFGDDLNPWLWPQLFDVASTEPNTLFVGIGSILHKGAGLMKLNDTKKIIFGSGVRPEVHFSNFLANDSLDIRFLRGPLSSSVLAHEYPYISDAAYAIRQLKDFDKGTEDKKYDVSVMPYFKSLNYIDWEKICKELGYHYISPLSEKGVEFTLQEIKQSRKLITEAMHGAIVADLYRVPWHRFIFSTPHTEGSMVSEFKWTDWLQSVKIYNNEVTAIPFYGKNKPINYFQKLTGERFSVNFFSKKKVERNIINKLKGDHPYYLSADSVINGIDEQFAQQIALLNGKK
jgi:succinoglycan biosynthesis protein ExoV